MKARCLGRRRTAFERGIVFFLLICCVEVSSFCPFRCVCNEDTLTVWCDGASLDVVPITLNPVLQELHLNGNKIKSIAASFTVYQNLHYLDMSQNLLTSLGSENFSEQKELLVLHLNSNKITSLSKKAFSGLAKLRILRLDGNFIADIADGAFEPLISLENLDLSRNRISTLTSSAFLGLSSLKELLLRDNKLTQIPTDAFQNITPLRSLDLGMNFLYMISKNSFHHLHHLQVLSLDGCGIHIIETGAFLGLDNIVSLFLQDNELQNVPTDVLMDIPFLQELHVGKNKMQKLGPSDFRGLRALKTITVNGEESLEVIENGTFADNHQLERLIISDNKNLNVVEHGTFRGLDNLRFLSLRGNQFTTFHEDMLPWDKLDVLDVRDNPLTCNCTVLWLRRLLKRENVSSYGEDVTRVRCKGPQAVSDRLLIEIGPDDLDCEGRSLKQILAIAVTGAAVILAAAAFLGFWHWYKYATKQKSKLGQSKRTLYQYGQNSENFSPILSQIVHQPLKSPAVAEL
ncbi:insulin-like growth factor-binding protein complex acid labile subunit [Uloborus diversus]|uniref:insulin-like growth factor-binding protein complex acid labile subunit n=1 Tax=Uloborus diversus TaxID=327109 RepID=UPI002409811D|nr:insulin-like growth factor-binding protein complex acid labile subunit [Uloborus diversus]XP_054724754.1 insulin-like growth factor-binding protein complex acid labile subunit [Uloborus diversus]XP_054724755.1 insulin-like growth factor-binding protein complex acid labile subunit [Uloborus diversus]XP_054724756.1 insulin-like growth factor-binding protein complex acid labile subunit [Uloborus diversus]XP_054724757.1 insulin-like growth factor-binding protein complex acid labile subunit [Ulob